MSPDEINFALNRLGELAVESKMVVDMAVFGGSALAIAFDIRDATKDVDAVFEKEKTFIRKAALVVAEELNLPDDWINDAVKPYLSALTNQETVLFRSYPSENNVGLRVFIPTPEYMLAMKCIDIRTSPTAMDVHDVKKLISICEVENIEQVLNVVTSFYPPERIQPKTIYALEEIFEQLKDSTEVKPSMSFTVPDYQKVIEFHRKNKKGNEPC